MRPFFFVANIHVTAAMVLDAVCIIFVIDIYLVKIVLD